MGADARLFVFDYDVYRYSVVPAFLGIIRDGTVDGWLQEVHRSHTEGLSFQDCLANDSSSITPIDLLKHCTYVDPELAVRKIISEPQCLYDCGWESRACHSAECPVREQCPFHFIEGARSTTVNCLLRLFRYAVADSCLGQGQFLGRSIDCFYYWETLDDLGVASADPIRVLLERLGRRGFLLGYAFAVGTDGIHGWLRPDEAKELGDRLFALNLPEYDCSFIAMEEFKKARNILEGLGVGLEFQSLVYEHSIVSFEQLSLSFVRTVCNLAVREGKGVLWGNDIA